MEVTAEAIRRLAGRPPGDEPVTSVYLDVDGSRRPRPGDYRARLDGLLHRADQQARALQDEQGGRLRESVAADARAVRAFVADRLDRDREHVRGVGVFASGGRVIDHVAEAIPVRDQVRVDPRPYVVPLEALLARAVRIGLVLVERDRARIVRGCVGRVEERTRLAADDAAPRNDGRAAPRSADPQQAEHHRHLRRTAEAVRAEHAAEQLDALLVAGPPAEAAALERELHPSVAGLRHGPVASLPLEADAEQLRRVLRTAEQELVSARRRALTDRLAEGLGRDDPLVAHGVGPVVAALNAGAVATLLAVEGAGVPGYRSGSGALATTREEATAYGEPVELVDDLVDEAIDAAAAAGAAVELFADPARLHDQPAAALLRFPLG